MKQSSILAPSLLSASFARLGQEAKEVLEAGAHWLHFDVMDNHFVPNLTMGPIMCRALRDDGIAAPIDVHLMVTHPETLIEPFAKAGATHIILHVEATPHLDRHLQYIRDLGCKAGLAFNPSTPLTFLDHVMEKLDLVLIMTVNPGFGGQTFIPTMLQKISLARKKIDQGNHVIRLAVDGGVNVDTIRLLSDAGADTFVAGHAIFHAADREKAVQSLLSKAD